MITNELVVNLKEVEDEAIEINRQFHNYRRMREQHRERVFSLMAQTQDSHELKELSRILMLTVKKEEE